MTADEPFFECDTCSHPGWYAGLSESPKCPKCGRDPVRYRDRDTVYCYVHRAAMTSHYITTSEFLVTTYVWQGHQHQFPNAKLYVVSEPGTNPADRISLLNCEQCETALRAWLKDHVDYS